VPGGELSADGQQWLASRPTFLVPVKPLPKLFRAKFRAALQKSDLFKAVSYQLWQEDWVVHSQAVGRGQAALKYLAPYIFRVAISNNRIIKVSPFKSQHSVKSSKLFLRVPLHPWRILLFLLIAAVAILGPVTAAPSILPCIQLT